jgi:hypothetical protein
MKAVLVRDINHDGVFLLSDPRVSDEAKEHAREVLSGGQESTTGAQPSEDLHETRVNAGYKSTLSSTSSQS